MKNFHLKLSILFSAVLYTLVPSFAQDRIDLGGKWEFAIDREGIGQTQSWFTKRFDDNIQLPGSMTENRKGDDITLETQWEGSLYDSSFFYNPRLEKYRLPGKLKIPFFLTPDKHYIGWAWYGKNVQIPVSWKDKRIVLYLERPHVETVIWVNGQRAGNFMSHCVPHEYDLTDWLQSGDNRIVIAIDNTTKEINVGKDSHSITDQTQGNWNGIVGKIYLEACPKVYIGEVQAFPDIQAKKALVKIKINNLLKGKRKGNIYLSAKSFNTGKTHNVSGINLPVTLEEGMNTIEASLNMGADVQLWDEFNPALYHLRLALSVDKENCEKEIQFGMREFTIREKYFHINGRPIVLRGTVENCCFPLTGYAPMDTAAWERIFRICKNYGLNHVRFHSYCPPEAAFIAADLVGIYLQPEGPSWPNHGSGLGLGRPIDDYLLLETQKMVEYYGNYASFCMLACGNEPAGNWVPWVSHFVDYWEKTDSRRVYTGASVGQSWAWQPRNQYHVKAGARGLAWNNRPESRSDYSPRIDTIRQAYVSHETGQWCAFPNFKEIVKYTGINKARNFELFQEDLADHDMAELGQKFMMASGKLQALCYKHEIEKTLRTPGYAGFQALSLNDYSGQGTALVGILDVFWDEKGYANAEQFRRFCAETVPLIRTDKFVYRNNESLIADVEISHFGQVPLHSAVIKWTLKDNTGKVLTSDKMKPIDIPLGHACKAGQIAIPLSGIDRATQLNLTVAIENTAYVNDWDFFVYPVREKPELNGIYETDTLDNTALEQLKNGGNVLLLTAGKVEYGKDIVQHFLPVFWNTSWFKMRPPHTTGILVDSQHPVFSDFPTDYHSNLQWWELVQNAQVMQLSAFPKGFQALIQSIDTWFHNRKIGMLFETKVLNGKIMVCSADLKSDWENRPVAQQLYTSILHYMQSDAFFPQYTVDTECIRDICRKENERINTYTIDTPDELKQTEESGSKMDFFLPADLGNFKLGVSSGEKSCWMNETSVTSIAQSEGKNSYSVKHPWLGKGSIRISVYKLTETKGFIMEVFPENIPENTALFWSYGGAGGEKDNVFSVEGSAFTVYYGESMALRTLQACIPPTSDIRLSDARQQSSPLAFYHSGKKTDTPALAAKLPIQAGTKYYFCLYEQNAQADYNYFMLEELFKNTAQGKHFDPFSFLEKKKSASGKPVQAAVSQKKHEGTVNVKDFGAKGDGKTIDSYAVNRAIEALASSGGGTLYFPAGNYFSYSIRLKSHIRLFLDAGAVITAAFPAVTEGYDEAEPNEHNRFQDFGHSHWKNSLLWAIGAEDITICGTGTIIGTGLSREESRLKGVANKAISLKECKNVILKDIRMLHCGHFALLATGVDNLSIDNLLIDTNRDGLDIDCCRNVRISNCTVNSPWDDAIVLKASYGLGYFKDTENVTITNCFVSGYDYGSVFADAYQTDEPQAPDHGFNCGRIKFGTESSGGFKNIAITNCVFEHCRGLALETVDGGSLEDITISNITMRDIVNAPLFLRLGARMRSPESTPVGKMRRILIDNINVFNADSRYASIISGIPGHPVEDVTLSNIRILYKGGYGREYATIIPPENEKVYPEPWMFGTIPAAVFFVRHANNIHFHHIYTTFAKEDFRPAFVLDDTQNISIKDTEIPLPDGVKMVEFRNQSYHEQAGNSLPDWVKTVGSQSFPASKNRVKVNAFGASGDGKSINTRQIQAAIDDCAGKGGGKVEFEPGTYLTGAIYLKSNVELYIAKGVCLKAIDRVEDFPDRFTRVAGIEMSWPSAIINVINQENVAVTGEGEVDGDGKYLWDTYWQMRKDYDKKGLRWIVDYDCKRVRSLLVSESKNVNISGLTFLRSGFWTIQLLYSSYCTVSGVNIRNNTDGHGPSTDGIDVDSSHHILIDACDIDCNDDNICLKAGRDADGLRVNRPTEYVFIRNCIARKGAGLMTCGSETSGDIRYICCTESRALGTSAALRIKSAMTRGGTVEHIYMSKVQADSVKYILNCDMNWNPSYSYSTLPTEYEGKNIPAHWKVMLQEVSPEQGLPHFRNIYLSDIEAKNTGVFVNCVGTEKSIIQDVEMKNLAIHAEKAGIVCYTDNFRIRDSRLQMTDGSTIETHHNGNLLLE
jgi:polygalacturonase